MSHSTPSPFLYVVRRRGLKRRGSTIGASAAWPGRQLICVRMYLSIISTVCSQKVEAGFPEALENMVSR
jgi:hypothetical protein